MNLKAAMILPVLLVLPALSFAQASSAPLNPVRRQYREGQTLAYHMKGINDAWHYEIDANGVVKKDPAEKFFEEYQWTNMTSEGKPIVLSALSADYRQKLTLDPARIPSAPDLRNVDPKMIGPITDLMTFYADLWLVNRLGVLKKSGDHFYFRNPMPPSSWADGSRVLVGEDEIDFDMTMKSLDPVAGVAVVEVKHVPPHKSALPLKAAWMQEPLATGANNWVEITKDANGKFEAAVGLETFTVELTVSLADGHIVSATMENPVTTIVRICDDEALTVCGNARRQEILRKIEIESR